MEKYNLLRSLLNESAGFTADPNTIKRNPEWKDLKKDLDRAASKVGGKLSIRKDEVGTPRFMIDQRRGSLERVLADLGWVEEEKRAGRGAGGGTNIVMSKPGLRSKVIFELGGITSIRISF